MDLLYPVARYVNAFTRPTLCLSRADVDAAKACPAQGSDAGPSIVPNPLFSAPPDGGSPRDASMVYVLGIVGVPWQTIRVTKDLVDTDATGNGILGALARAANEVALGGRLWFVFVGHGGADLVPADGGDARDGAKRLKWTQLVDASATSAGEPFVVFDTGFDRGFAALLGSHADRKSAGAVTRTTPIVMETTAT